MTYHYSDEQKAAILRSLPGSILCGIHRGVDLYLTDDKIINIFEAWASRYIWRVCALTPQLVARNIRALEVVLTMLKGQEDALHRDRIMREKATWETDLFLIEKKRERRARMRFIVDMFGAFAKAGGANIPLAEYVTLSDSKSPAFEFFETAIQPVCAAANEAIQIRQAITIWLEYLNEMRQAEIDMMLGEIKACAMKSTNS